MPGPSQQEQQHDDRPLPSKTSMRGLDGFAFFLADVQTGFGPFLAVYLTTEKWTNADIGLVLSIGAVIGLLGQMPAGAMVDALRREKLIATTALIAIGISAFMIAVWPQFLAVLAAQIIHVGASAVVGPAIAAISLGLVGHALIGERLGRNARYASIGGASAAALMGACGHYFSNQAVFFVTAGMAIPAVVAIAAIRSDEIVGARLSKPRPEASYSFRDAVAQLGSNRSLLILALCVGLFHLANAAMLPLVASTITMRSSEGATVLVALCMIVPQVIVALSSPTVGRLAQSRGRKPLLIVGFAALPVRAVLLSFQADPATLVMLQVLDGISASVLGVVVAVSVADLTRNTGSFNLGLGIVGTAMGIGATISTTLAGIIADQFGSKTAFIALSLAGLAGLLTLAAALPETRPETAAHPRDDWKQ